MAQESIYCILGGRSISIPNADLMGSAAHHTSRSGTVAARLTYTTFPDKKIHNNNSSMTTAAKKQQTLGTSSATASRAVVEAEQQRLQYQSETTGANLFSQPACVISRSVRHEIHPQKFLRAHGSGRDELPEVGPPRCQREVLRIEHNVRKPRVPPVTERPVMGMHTKKNFVRENTLAVINSNARHVPGSSLSHETAGILEPLKKKDFGRIPKYLSNIKAQLNVEASIISERKLQASEQQSNYNQQFMHSLDNAEQESLIQGLKQRWGEKHLQYQSLPVALDTQNQKRRKEHLELELKEIETLLQKLTKKVVYTYRDDVAPHMTHWARHMATRAALSNPASTA